MCLVIKDNGQRIGKDSLSFFKTDAVLCEIGSGFEVVPFKFHSQIVAAIALYDTAFDASHCKIIHPQTALYQSHSGIVHHHTALDASHCKIIHPQTAFDADRCKIVDDHAALDTDRAATILVHASVVGGSELSDFWMP